MLLDEHYYYLGANPQTQYFKYKFEEIFLESFFEEKN